jgi:hypothetical protein
MLFTRRVRLNKGANFCTGERKEKSNTTAYQNNFLSEGLKGRETLSYSRSPSKNG